MTLFPTVIYRLYSHPYYMYKVNHVPNAICIRTHPEYCVWRGSNNKCVGAAYPCPAMCSFPKSRRRYFYVRRISKIYCYERKTFWQRFDSKTFKYTVRQSELLYLYVIVFENTCFFLYGSSLYNCNIYIRV